MRFVSWNVNGLRACVKKGFEETFYALNADVFCLQETKLQPGQLTLELPQLYFVCVYTPNSQDGLRRLDYRMQWEDDFRDYLLQLDAKKPVVVGGDFNVAHQEIDLKNPGTNRTNPGFTDAERGRLTQLLAAGFTDSFRHLYPDRTGAYTWWSYRANARANNTGWRIDYFLTSDRLAPCITGASIWPEVMGSDHCPVMLELSEELC